MALKQGKRLVNLKSSVADNIGIPKYPDTNIAAQISKPISEAIDSFRKIAESDASVQFKTSFNKTSTEHYLNLKKKFEFDPDGMKNAVDAYAKNTIENTPRVYRDYATNILAQKNLANLNYAAANHKNLNTNISLKNWQTTRTENENLYAENMDNIQNDSDVGWFTINSYTANTSFKNLNESYGTAEDNLVNTNRYKGTQLKKDLEKDLENLETLRVYNLMVKDTEDGSKGDALTYLNNYAAGKDSRSLTEDLFENKNERNNPIFKKYQAHITNDFNRAKIVKEVMALYQSYNGDKIKGLNVTKEYNLDGLQEPGQILNVINFEDAKNTNAVEYVIKNMPNAKPKDRNDAIKIVEDHIQIQQLVSDAKNGTKISFRDIEQKTLFGKAILANNGINDENITDITNPDLGKAVSLMARYDIKPEAIINRLNTKVNVDFNNPGQIEIYKENLGLYKFIKAQYPGLTLENSFIYEEGLKMGATAVQDNKSLGFRLNDIVKDVPKYQEREKKITENLALNAPEVAEQFAEVISTLDINTDSWWAKKFGLSEKNKYTDLFHNSGTKLLPNKSSTLLTPEVKAKWLENTMTHLTHMAGNKDFDLNSDEGKIMFQQASIKALDSLKDQGFTGTKFSGNNQIKMVKNAYEDKIGIQDQGFENSIIAYGEYLNNTLTETQKKERFGSALIGKSIFKKGKIVSNNINNIIKKEIDNGFENTIIEFAGTYNEFGQPNYHLKMNHNNTIINLTEGNKYFDPTAFAGVNKISGKNGSRDQLILTLAEQKYEAFEKTFGHLLDGNSWSENFAKSVVYKTIKMGIEASDYKWYPDIPGLNDVPTEMKPFAFIFKTLGIDVDLKPYYDEGIKINNEIDQHLSMDAQIESDTRISPKDKKVESVFPPYKTEYTRQNASLYYRKYAYDNYQNTSLPLTLRTNNYMAVMKTDSSWEGEITDINTGNQAAIFARPQDSIRAGIRVMINNSSIINNNTTKRYGDTPTIEEILTSYAEKTEPYLNALEAKTDMTRDTVINFLDNNQMHGLIKFMIEHEMGSAAFNKYYPADNQVFLDSMIFDGYEQGINSYKGQLGKIR